MLIGPTAFVAVVAFTARALHAERPRLSRTAPHVSAPATRALLMAVARAGDSAKSADTTKAEKRLSNAVTQSLAIPAVRADHRSSERSGCSRVLRRTAELFWPTDYSVK